MITNNAERAMFRIVIIILIILVFTLLACFDNNDGSHVNDNYVSDATPMCVGDCD